ncbi:MAG: RND family efflux transporter MFP subunit [Cellvibrionaceae bacterium]|jgi:RND family efflux transporter MFP subunit
MLNTDSLSKPTPYRHSRGATTALLILAVGIAIIAALWFFRPQPTMRTQPVVKPPAVEVLSASTAAYQVQVKTQGTVVPRRQILLVSEVSGLAESVSKNFIDGGIFSEGDILVKLDGRDYAIAVTNARSTVANAERELALERGLARQAEREWRELGNRQANDLFLRKPQVNAAEATLAAARATLQQAELNLNRTKIRAPFAGRIQATEVDLGQFVPQGTAIADIYDSQWAEIRLPLTMKQLLQTKLSLTRLANGQFTLDDGSHLAITLSAILGEQSVEWQARLVGMDASIDPRTRFTHLIAVVDRPFSSEQHQQPLIMGLFVEVTIPGRRFPTALRLPNRAILEGRVFVVDETRRLRSQAVTVIAREDDGTLWVDAPEIEVGELIVVSDPRVLREGMSVTLIDEKLVSEQPDRRLNNRNFEDKSNPQVAAR